MTLPHGTLRLPVFLPDGTQGVVRSVDTADLTTCGIQAVQMNGYHLMQRPGSSTIQALGGLHRMTGWSGPIFTDSGGFQIYSLLHQNEKLGSITDKGAVFRPEGGDRRYNLTPEKSIQLQMSYGADMVICLDDCTHVDAPMATQEASVRRTVAWAQRCKTEFERIVAQKGLGEGERPYLIAVVQGGNSHALRRECAEALLAIGFDGYGYGGWPLDGEGNLLTEMLAHTRQLIPRNFTLHALGVGHPANVVTCAQMGYEIFDSTMPTRDARHGRLLAFTVNPKTTPLQGDWFEYVYIKDKKHIKNGRPVSPYCDCPVCLRYSLGYLHHLFKLNDSLFPRLATMHNLRFMTLMMENLRREGIGD
ncbi:MAG: queuine tRNA-ribosyltransferase family protein [Anaerolineales bacterium]|nr:queuine tRNA-ribosyltransferase family protein [Anaerolineales bacterium]